MCNTQSKKREDNKTEAVASIDETTILRLDVEELKSLHHTSDYKPTLELLSKEYVAVRRGLPLKFSIDSRMTDLTKMELSEAFLVLADDEDKLPVTVTIETCSKFLMKGSVALSLDTTPVGFYDRLLVKLSPKSQETTISETFLSTRQSILILFNPWCKDEKLFIQDESKRTEYVLNDRGVIWITNVNPRPWYIAQFHESTIVAATRIISAASLSEKERCDPLQVSKIIAKGVSEAVLKGKLSGNYEEDGGKNPFIWKGSDQILREFCDQNRPVSYAQSWVYAGVLCSLLRCLGYPTRPITIYNSAHEIASRNTDPDVQVGFYLDNDANPVSDSNVDALWDFHCWVEFWCSRDDLTSFTESNQKFSPLGWQALDSYPQPGDLTFLGPSSVSAIKEGLLELPYQTNYFYGEVSADRVILVRQLDGSYKEVLRNSSMVGSDICTKSVGKVDRDVITNEYKYPEGSKGWTDQKAMGREHKITAQSMAVIGQKVSVEFNIPTITTGNDAQVYIDVSNASGQIFEALVQAKGFIIKNNGEVVEKVYSSKAPWKKFYTADNTNLSFTVPPSKYLKYLNEQVKLVVYVYVQLKESNQRIIKQHTAYFIIPPPIATLADTVKAYEPFNLNVTFKNPLPIAMTDVTIVGNPIKGVTSGFELILGDLPAGKSVSEMHYLKIFKEGRHKMLITLYSKELPPTSCLADMSVLPPVSS